MRFRRLDGSALPVATVELARAVIGCFLVRETTAGITAGRIVESEAYGPGDPASHAFIGLRPRTASMFLKPFHAYVYQIYGMYFCFNIASEPEGEGAGVLIRALEPVEGIEIMQRRRGIERVRDLCRGPGRLCSAMAIDRQLDGVDLLSDARLWLAGPEGAPAAVAASRRIGISRAAAVEARFFEWGNAMVSGPKEVLPE